jgi:eukaryotic-like serine/threonine-protein kinase
MTQFHSTLQIGIALGAGHFGQVFAGTDQLHGDVAIKILEQYRGESASDWQTRKADLLSEGKRLEAASHPNVVRVYSVVESTTSNAILLVMERCTGGCLDHRFKIGPMLLSETRNIATDIALGLQALHQRGMLHRDIKPGNILLDGRGKAKLGDFGLVTDNLVLGYASQQGYADHVAYEVWQGHGTSEKSDIWAFGMTIYRLLHGEDWYSRSLAPRHLVQNGGFADQLPWLPHIPKPWRRFIRKTLEDDTALRYQNMSQVKKCAG